MNHRFKSYLTNRMQYVSINGIVSDPLKVKFGLPQRSVLGSLLVLFYINNLHDSVRFYSPFNFADNKDLLNIQGSICVRNKIFNID